MIYLKERLIFLILVGLLTLVVLFLWLTPFNPNKQFHKSSDKNQQQNKSSNLQKSINIKPKVISLNEKIDQQLRLGYAVIKFPREMKELEFSEVELQVTKEVPKLNLDLTYWNLIVIPIKIGDKMSVSLKGDDFIIRSIDRETKLIIAVNDGLWKWQVKPKYDGTCKLFVRVMANVKDLGSQEIEIDCYQNDFNITVENKIWGSVLLFLKENWPWLIPCVSAIAAAIVKCMTIIRPRTEVVRKFGSA